MVRDLERIRFRTGVETGHTKSPSLRNVGQRFSLIYE